MASSLVLILAMADLCAAMPAPAWMNSAVQPCPQPTPERRHVEGNQHEAQRNHPESEHRQESQHTARQQQQPKDGAEAEGKFQAAPCDGAAQPAQQAVLAVFGQYGTDLRLVDAFAARQAATS